MYTRFGDNDKVNRQAQELVTSTWTNNLNNLNVAFTSSTQADTTHATSSGQFFIEVSNEATTEATSEVQYAVAYGHRHGTGSPNFTDDTGSFGIGASRVIYNQYRQLHFNDDTANFTFGTHTPDDIYVINVNRGRYKQRLTLGSLDLRLRATSIACDASQSQHTIHLTDDSVTNPGGVGTSNLGTFYNIVSGSKGVVLSGTTATTQVGIHGSADTFTGSYGNFYPEAGLIILNGSAFSQSLESKTTATATDQIGALGAFTTTSSLWTSEVTLEQPAAAMKNAISRSANFIVDTTEEINSEFYFCRAQNNQYNYTNNESFVDANKNIRFETMQLNPKVFITTVGLYNDAFELVAIAKLSQPIAKDFTKEALIRVKLDY
tara:strand:- start:182 stop:1312 length:1131 start_codon:yes stop_codon:yes gene_type:complete